MTKKIRISSLVPKDVISEAIQMSNDSPFSEVFILSDDSGFVASSTSDIGVEHYRVIASYSEGVLNWVADDYEDFPDE